MKEMLLIFASIHLASAGYAEEKSQKRIYYTKRIYAQPPAIDGKASDDVWNEVKWAGGFIQRKPYEGKQPQQQTNFKVLYDDDYLYFLVRSFDAEPEKIEQRVTRRDQFDGDWVEISIDSYLDSRTAFSFTLSAAGGKGDGAITDDGEDTDVNWDPVWDGATAIHKEGWDAEMRIPLSRLRFSEKDEHIWGLQIQRHIFRKEERSLWQFIPQKTGGWVSYFGELRGLTGLRPGRRIEIIPYTAGSLNHSKKIAGNPFADGLDSQLSAGLDSKIGVTSDLTLDLTVNPDFGQVEADPSVVNLTAFETFFVEKRPFFIEGQNILDFPLMNGNGDFSNDRIFYTRRIGRQPQRKLTPGKSEFIDMPESSAIKAALKLTGKTDNDLSIGFLSAFTGREDAVIDLAGQRRKEAVEPQTNYSIGRIQKDFNQGNSSLGGMLTATSRDIANDRLRSLNHTAWTGGLDYRHQWQDKTYYLEARAAFSHIRGSTEAISNVQKSSAHYFIRPDAKHLEYNPGLTSLSGHGGMINVGRGGQKAIRFAFGTMWRSPGLELNDLGFMREADRIMQWGWVGYLKTEPFSFFRSMQLNFNQKVGLDFGGERLFAGGDLNGNVQLKNNWFIWAGIGRDGTSLSTSALYGGPAMKFPSKWKQWVVVETDRRRPVYLSMSSFNIWHNENNSGRYNVNFAATYQPVKAASIQISSFYVDEKENLQFIQKSEYNSDTRYLFGTIDRKTLGMVFRLNYSITPDLSVQCYVQPFVSSGAYSEFKRITDSRAAVYNNRFHLFTSREIKGMENKDGYAVDEDRDGRTDYTFQSPSYNQKQFRSNLILRWEYSPGSTAFLVWSQRRTGISSDGTFSFRNDLNDLFGLFPDDVFLLKISRYFSL